VCLLVDVHFPCLMMIAMVAGPRIGFAKELPRDRHGDWLAPNFRAVIAKFECFPCLFYGMKPVFD
jgi:hypothetical protein